MKKRAIFVLAIGLLALVVAGVMWFKKPPTATERSLFVYCGNSMRPPMEEIAQNFERQTRIKVDFNFGGCETLLPAIKVSRKGDVFICHDPFGAQLRQENLLAGSVPAGQLAPVIVVAKGNPLKIQSLADLARPETRVGLLDARYSTCGQIVKDALKARNLEDAVQKNVKVETRNHSELATAIRLNQLDVALVWNFIGTQYKDLEVVPTTDRYPETKVTVCALSCAANREGAELLLKMCAAPEGLAIFERLGYGIPKTIKKK